MLLNYTTKISVIKTLGEIQEALVEHGARKVMLDYDEKKRAQSLSFGIETPAGWKYIRIVAKPEGVQKVLASQGQKCDMEQAARIAWRIVKNLVEAQMAMIEAQLADMEKLFFSDLLEDDGGERTVFEIYREKQQRLMSGEVR